MFCTDFTRGGDSPSACVLSCTSSWPHQSLMLTQIFPLASLKMGQGCITSVLASPSSALSRFVCKYQLFVYCYTNFAFPLRSLHYIFLLIHHILPHTNPSVLPITSSRLVMQSPETFNFHRCIFSPLLLSLDNNSGNRVLLQ